MEDTHATNDTQAALWNGVGGHAWVEAQTLLDRIFKPVETVLVEAVRTGAGRRVLDVGCGTGGTTRAVARALGSKGRAAGIDISEPMIAAARSQAERDGVPASFIHADAQRHAFAPAGFDTILSRFGVMFFDDPVRAFANLRQAARDAAALRVVAWRSPAENPFMTAAERAAAPLLPGLPAREPDAPGQFAFADADRVHRILTDSGWTGIEIAPIDVACTLPERDLTAYLSRLGPVGRHLQERTMDDRTRARVIETVRTAFDPFVHGTEARFIAALWWIQAEAPVAPDGGHR